MRKFNDVILLSSLITLIKRIQKFCTSLLQTSYLDSCLKFIFLTTFHSKLFHIDAWLTDQTLEPLDIEGKALFNYWWIHVKWDIQSNI